MIWSYCLHFEDNVEIAVMAQRLVSCKGGLRIPGREAPTALTPQLLRTNKQIRKAGFVIMCNSNNFSIVLNQASYLGYPSRISRSFVSVAGPELASIPSTWTQYIRYFVRQMRTITLYLTLNTECGSVGSPQWTPLKTQKSEIAAIVSTALMRLRETLSLSLKQLDKLESKSPQYWHREIDNGQRA